MGLFIHDEHRARSTLAAQKIYFPPQGSLALAPAKFPSLQQYAGQEVLTGPQTKAFADDYIAFHLQKVADGKTYSEVSTEALANPTDIKLQNEANTLFKGETLRGLLLGDAYAFWTVGHYLLCGGRNHGDFHHFGLLAHVGSLISGYACQETVFRLRV